MPGDRGHRLLWGWADALGLRTLARRYQAPDRLRSDAAFAMLCGASPIEASSGKTRRPCGRVWAGGPHHAQTDGRSRQRGVLHAGPRGRRRPGPLVADRLAGAIPATVMGRVAGGVLIAAGVVVLVQAFVRFVAEGAGTPAPVAPTKQLVVGGLYRYVRNPMYLAVVATKDRKSVV